MSSKNNNNKCSCTGIVKNPLIETVGCSEDLAAVSNLPDEWTPRHGGPTLINYLEEQKHKHETVHKNLFERAVSVNNEIDNKAKALAENVLCAIQENDKEITCVIEKFKPKEGKLSLEDRNEALKQVTELINKRIQDLALFKQEGISLERQRSDGLRDVLQDHFHRLIAVGHKTPNDLLHEFDEKIYEINQQLLSNNRAYIELEAQLRAQSDDRIFSARSSLNQLCISSSKILRTRSALPWSQNDTCHKNSISLNEKRHNTGEISTSVLTDLEEFEECISGIVNAYRGEILKVFGRFVGQLDILHKNIGVGTASQMDSKVDLKEIIDKALFRISDRNMQYRNLSYQDLEEMTRNDILNMQNSLVTLGERLKDTYTILYSAGHMWDAHILRSALVQKLTPAAVEDMQMVHDAMELANEVSFNIVLEQLRCASDTDKLQQHFDVAMNLLDRITDIYQQHSQLENGKLEDFMNLLPLMNNILLSECDYFLEKYPKLDTQSSLSLISPSDSIMRYSQQMFSLRAPLPRATFQTHLQVAALNNWRNGFLESFQNNLSAIPEELSRHARKWVDNKCLQLNIRHSMKLVSHSVRPERIEASREARLAEIKLHDSRLNSHIDAVFELIDRLPQEASEFLAIDSSDLYPLCSWIKNMETDINELLARDPLDPEVKRLKMSSYAPRLIRHRENFAKSLDDAIDAYKKNIEREIHVARISNFRFMKQLKLFNEGGKYSASEALRACGALTRAADALELSVHRVMDCLNHRRTQLLNSADQLILPVQRSVDEVHKYGAKPTPDKKKPPPNKKK